jgi:hypothetical protein
MPSARQELSTGRWLTERRSRRDTPVFELTGAEGADKPRYVTVMLICCATGGLGET